MTEAEHREAILVATRGTIGDYIEACIAAVKDGHSDAVGSSTMEAVWISRAIEAEKKGRDEERDRVVSIIKDKVASPELSRFLVGKLKE